MLGLDNIHKTKCVLIYPINKMYGIPEKKPGIKWSNWNIQYEIVKKQKNTCNYTVTCMCTLMIFATVLSPTIKIFHRLLGPNLYIFAVKVSPTFYGDFMTYHRHFTTKKHRPRWFRAKNCCAYCNWLFGNSIEFYLLYSKLIYIDL
jgi:hypothetical protein